MANPDPASVASEQTSRAAAAADPHHSSSARVAVVYLIAGLLWIGMSDVILAGVGGLTTAGFLVSIGKGALFVLLSTCLVYTLCRREYGKSSRTMALLRAVVEGTTDAVFVKDCDGRYLLVNAAAASFMDRSVAEVLGCDDRELFNRPQAEQLMASDRAIMASGGVVTLEETLTSGSTTRTFQATKAPHFDSNGAVIGLIGISRNITDRIQVETALRETDARLRESQRIARLGSWSWEPQTNRVWWSDAEFELFGVDRLSFRPSFEAFLGLLHPDDRAIAISRVEAIQAGADAFANDMRIIRADGTCIWIHSQARVTRNAVGEVFRVEGTDQDITANRLAEDAVRESEQRLQAAVEVAGLGVIVVDYDLQTAELSHRAAEQFGLPPGTMALRAELHSRFHPDHVAELAKLIEGALDPAGSGRFALEHRVLRPDGTSRWLNVRKQVSFADGRPHRAVVVTADATERKRAESELRESEARYRLLFESNPHPMWVYDVSTFRFLAVNDAALVAYGYTRDQFLAMTIKDIRPPGEIERLELAVARTLPGLSRSTLWKHRRKNGTVFDVEIAGHDLQEGTGRSRLVLALDITERVVATEALKTSEARYRQLADMLPTAILVHADNQVLYGNPAMLRLIGASDSNELLGRNPFELLHESSHDIHRRRQNEMARTGMPLPGCEMLGLRCDGRTVPIHVVAAPVDGYGGPATLVAISDLTERDRSAALLRSVLDSVGDAILTIDVNGTVSSANKATERLFGYAELELLGANVSVLMPEPYLWQHDQYVANYLRTGVPEVIGIGREVEGRRKDGTVFPAELTITEFLRDGEKEFTGVLRDITARRQLEEQFRQAQKMEAVGRLAGGVAHDFNNLLTVINGYTELLLEGLTADNPAKPLLTAVHDAGDRAARLTQQLLAFSRKSVVEPQLIDLNELVAASTNLLCRLIGEDVTLLLLTHPSPIRVLIDPGQLEQVLMNLAVNARDAMPTGGQLTIETRLVEYRAVENMAVEQEAGAELLRRSLPSGLCASVRVTDTGCGMSANVREKIFEPFFTTKGLAKGTGLGLAVVHGVVQQSGGLITVDSKVGETTFTVLLPLASDETSALGASSSADTFIDPRGSETMLVVEDEEAVRTIVRVALEGQGYKVLTAPSGKEALDVIQANRGQVDLLITDVIMPEISGRELVEAARKTRPELRVLYMSGYTDDALDRHGLQGTDDHFIQKPFTPLSLARKVRAILDQAGGRTLMLMLLAGNF